MPVPVLYPASPLDPRRVDPHFAEEAAAARELEAATPKMDHDALLDGDAEEAVRRVPRDLGPMWYRGWMIPSANYAALDAALHRRGGALAVPADDYRRAHELPGWYPVFDGTTPQSRWVGTSPGQEPPVGELVEAAADLKGGPGIVKDYVKSRKHEWSEACFIPDLADTGGLHRVVGRFVELQEQFLAGGVVLRRFEQFVPDTAEARVWWVDGFPALVGPHPDTPDTVPTPELDHIAPLVRRLGCRFITTDVALRRDGVWRVVEVGDGQVSDRPATVDPALLLSRLLAAD